MRAWITISIVVALLGLHGLASAQSAAAGWSGARNVIVPQTRSFRIDARPGAVQIDAVQAKVAILEQTARTTLQIDLVNTGSTQEEAELLLPVPDGAAVSQFMFQGAASEPTARLLPRDEARRTYESIVRKIRDPALLEFAGYNLVRSSVFPVPAGGTQRVRLTYENVLEADGDRVDYVLPRSESLALRRPWRIRLELKAKSPIAMVYSPSHDLDTQRVDSRSLRVAVRDASASDPGAFRLSYLLEREGVSASLFAYPDPAVGGGYFLMMAGLPVSPIPAEDRLKREVTVALDRSGSMAGEKMDQARQAALQVIEGLEDGEAFNIVDYSTTVSKFAARPVVKTRETTLQARAYLDGIRSGGGTNIYDALSESLRSEPREGMLSMVLFLTDGLPTIGKTSELAIRELVEKHNPHRRRVFTFGVGNDVNVPLLDRLADSSRATATYILPEEDVELKVAQVFRRLRGPALAHLGLKTYEGGQESTRLVRDLIPHELPDLFEGDPLIVLGQYTKEGEVEFELTGEANGRHRAYRFSFDLGAATTRNAFVGRLWASRRIAYLVDQIRQAGAEVTLAPRVQNGAPGAMPDSELVDEILRLSTEFGVLTEYTAFLATEGTDLSNWSDLNTNCVMALNDRAILTRSGQGAVNQGMNFNWQIAQTRLNYDNGFFDDNMNRVATTEVQQVCDRAFFRRGDRWIDSRLVANNDALQPDETVEFGSEEHLELLRRLIGEGRQGVLSLDGEILLQLGDRRVLVTQGQE